MPTSRPGPAAAVGHLLTPCQPPTQPRGPVNEEGQIAAPFQSGLSPHCPPSPQDPTRAHRPLGQGRVLSWCDPDPPAHKQQKETPAGKFPPSSGRTAPREAFLTARTQAWGSPQNLGSPQGHVWPPPLSQHRFTVAWVCGGDEADLSPARHTGHSQEECGRQQDAHTHAHTHTRTHTRARRLAGWSEQSRRRSPGRRVLQEHRRHDGSRSLDGQTRDV